MEWLVAGSGPGCSGADWSTDEGQRLAGEVFVRLRRGRRLSDLGLGTVDGRTDLRGITAAIPRRSRRFQFGRLFVEELSGLVELRDCLIEGIDFGGALLPNLRFFDSEIRDCRFDAAQCRGWRMWRTRLEDVGFRRANLRDSALGPFDGAPNRFDRVDFRDADLRGIASSGVEYVDCDFGGARLDGVDFQSSSLVRCRFAGVLKGVIFYAHGFQTGKPDPNPMEDVDFSEAVLRDVEFRGLNLDRVRFPVTSDHFVTRNYRCVIEYALTKLQGDESTAAQYIRSALEHRLKWVGPSQQVGVFNIDDLSIPGGAEQGKVALDLLRRCESHCDEQNGGTRQP